MDLTPLKCYHAEKGLVKGMIYGWIASDRSGKLVMLDRMPSAYPRDWFDSVTLPSPDDNWCQPGRKVVFRGYNAEGSRFADPRLPQLPFESVHTIEEVSNDDSVFPAWYGFTILGQPSIREGRFWYASCWFEPLDD